MPILFILLSLLFITACEKEAEPTKTQSSWSLKTPLLISAERGTKISFKELQYKRPDHMLTSDSVQFADASKKIQLNIKTICTKDDKHKKHELQIKLPTQLSIGEMLPVESRLTADWSCSFKFIATHNGSEHYFELGQYLIKDDTKSEIIITDDPSNQSQLIRVYADSSYKTYFISQKKGNRLIVCENSVFQTASRENIVRLDQFNTTNTLDNDRTYLCRGFVQDSGGRTAATSDLFWHSPQEPRIDIKEIKKRRVYSDIISDDQFEFMGWSLNNKSNFDINIAVPKLNISFPIVIATINGRGGYYGESFDTSVYLQTGLDSQHSDENFDYYKIPAYSKIALYLKSRQNYFCNRQEVGLYTDEFLENFFDIYLLNKLDTVKEVNTTLKIPFNMNRQWIGRRNPVMSGKYKIPYAKYDHIGAFPVHIHTYANVRCQKY